MNRIVAGVFALAALPMQAYAAVPAAVSDALANLATDALMVAGSVLAAIVAVYALKFVMRGVIGNGGGKWGVNAPGFSDARLSEWRQATAADIWQLRRDGWTNSEIRGGSRGLEP